MHPALDRLEAEHERSGPAVRELENGLTAGQLLGESHRAQLLQLVDTVTRVNLGRMKLEENDVLSVAGDFLSDGDWHELEGARMVSGAS